MIPTQEFENFPEFANAGEKTQPNDQKYAQGFLPSDTLPAEWQNWFLAGATRGITALDTGLSSVEAEINTVLQSRQEQPSATATNQLLTVLEKIKAEAILAAHPVGSLYWTSKNENPAITFGGGTWKQIKDKFILAAGDTYTAEATGGSATKTLDITQIPAHTHGLNSHTHTLTPAGTVSSHSHGLNSHTHTLTPAGTVSSHSHGLNSHTHTLTPAGTVSSHSHGLNSHTHSVGAHSHGLASHKHDMDHTHPYTATGTVSSHSHGLNSHTHTIGAHSHGLNNHVHGFKPTGTVTVTTNPTFSGSSQTTGSVGAHYHFYFSGDNAPTVQSSYASGKLNAKFMNSGSTITENLSTYSVDSLCSSRITVNEPVKYPYSSEGSANDKVASVWADGEGNGNKAATGGYYAYGFQKFTSYSGSHSHSITPAGTISGGAYSFSGIWGTTDESAGNTTTKEAYNTGTSSGNTTETQPTFTGKQALTSTCVTPSSTLQNMTYFSKTGAATGNTDNSTAFNSGAATGDTTATQPTFTGTQGTTSAATGNTEATAPTFTGTQGTTSAATGNTAASTPTFTGTQGTTSAATGNTTSTGGLAGVTQAVNIMPPYEVKYCWERTA